MALGNEFHVTNRAFPNLYEFCGRACPKDVNWGASFPGSWAASDNWDYNHEPFIKARRPRERTAYIAAGQVSCALYMPSPLVVTKNKGEASALTPVYDRPGNIVAVVEVFARESAFNKIRK